MQDTITKLYISPSPLYAARQNQEEYQKAWKRLEQLSRKLNTLWKTKKSSIQILKEERV